MEVPTLHYGASLTSTIIMIIFIILIKERTSTIIIYLSCGAIVDLLTPDKDF